MTGTANGVPKQYSNLKDYEYQLFVLFKRLLETGPKTPDELLQWSSRQYRFEQPTPSYRFQAAAADPAVNRLCILALVSLEYLQMRDGKISLPQPRTLDDPWLA